MGNNALIVGPPHTGKLTIAQLVTGDLDCSTVSSETHSGLVFQHTIETKYFTASINILIEEYPDSRNENLSSTALLNSLEEFTREFEKPEYQDLRDEIEVVIFTVDLSRWTGEQIHQALGCFKQLKAFFGEKDLFYAVVGNGKDLLQQAMEEVENDVMRFGFELIDVNQSGVNEFREKLGTDRLLELFECHEWSEIDSVPVNFQRDNLKRTKECLSDEQAISFDRLLERIKLERERLKDLDPPEKEKLAKAFVEDVMENFR